MDFNVLKYEYPSRRGVIFGKRGMVCTSQNLAAEAGLDILKRGGNAIDAAIATAICLTVVEPTSNGIGSNAFALVWVKDKLYGLNASGPAPMLATAQKVREKGYEEMPTYGMLPITVPGAPAAWTTLSERFGKLPFEELFEPAIRYAEEGFPVSPVISEMWNTCYERFSQIFKGEEHQGWFDVFAPDGAAPKAGDIWKSPVHAQTLRKIAASRGKALYGGELAQQIGTFCEKHGGYLRKEDLAAFKAQWVEPIHINYKGYDVWEIPPNGHGIVALMTLNILKDYDFAQRNAVETFHAQLEAMKLAYADGKRYVTDPRYMKVRTEQLLSEEYASERRKLIGEKAMVPEPGRPDKGGTVYLCTADDEGNMVSFIQSSYWNFGSGIVAPDTGICLQNRGNNFSLDDASENVLAPGKKPYHTIIPAFLSKYGKPVAPFGVMGGFMQPQGHVQVVMNMIDFHLNPQEALDAPRWQWVGDKEVHVERGFPVAATEELVRKGHEIHVLPTSMDFGRGQIIYRMENGTLMGATEPRTDGCVAAW